MFSHQFMTLTKNQDSLKESLMVLFHFLQWNNIISQTSLKKVDGLK